MNRLEEIYREVEEIRDREATKLFRLSRKAVAHGCSVGLCVRIRNEAWKVYHANPEDLLNPFLKWEFAFKLDGSCFYRRSKFEEVIYGEN